MKRRMNPYFKIKIQNDSYDFEFPTITIEEKKLPEVGKNLENETRNLNNELSENEKTEKVSVESELKEQNETGAGGPGTEIINFLNSATITALCNFITLSPYVIGLLVAINRTIRSKIEESLEQDYESIHLPTESMYLEALDNLKNHKHKDVVYLIYSSDRFNEKGDSFFIFRIRETDSKDLFFLYEFRQSQMQEPYIFY
jgi:hypothetical protein